MRAMTTRRQTLLQSLDLVAAGLFATGPVAAANSTSWRMPDEAEPHKRTWMAFGPRADVWGAKLLPEVQHNLATIALAIARFEPVSMLVRSTDMARAKQLMGTAIDLVPGSMDDLWMRDTGPVFVRNTMGAKAAVRFNFNGWGGKQAHALDAKIVSSVASIAGAQLLTSSLILEGGGIEVDGQGTAIITESCVLNPNRNPGVSKSRCEAELKRLLGLEKIIWLPGTKGHDITDGHTDFYARFAQPSVVVAGFDADPTSFDHAVTRRHLDILRGSTDAGGKKLEVVVMEGPATVRNRFANKEFAAGYINFYVCNGGVLAPQFGDRHADAAAKETLQSLFPKHTVVQLNIDGIAVGGGGIHCTTQQEPA